jgi:hypothetical protein
MDIDFFDLAQAQQRLQNSLIRVKKSLAYVICVYLGEKTKYSLEVKYLASGKVVMIPLDDKVDLTPLPLGNINYQGDCYYLSRAPARKWKQGLTVENLTCRNYLEGYNNFPVDKACIADCVNNSYPTAKIAVESVEKDYSKAVAFSRNFSIIKNRIIVYNCKIEVGSLAHNYRDFKLNDNAFFLKEMLQEALDR